MSLRQLAICAIGLSCLFVPSRPSAAADPKFVEDVTWLLNAGWRGDAESLTHASHHLANAQSVAPGDPRPLYAWSLVQIKIGNRKQAAAMLSGVVADQPDAISPRQVQLWLLADGKDYPTMLSSTMAMAVHLPRADATEAPNAEQTEAANFLGRMFGYFTGPGAGIAPDAKWEQREKLITENFHPALRDAFQAGRVAVAKKPPSAGDSSTAARDSSKADDKPITSPAAATTGKASSPDQAAADALKAKYLSDRAEAEKKVAELQAEFSKMASEAQVIGARMPKTKELAQTKSAQAQSAPPAEAVKLRTEAQAALIDLAKDQMDLNRLNVLGEEKAKAIAQQQDAFVKRTNQFKADAAKLGPAGAATLSVAKPLSKTAAIQIPAAPAADATDAKKDGEGSEELTTLDGCLPLSLKVQRQRLLDSLAK